MNALFSIAASGLQTAARSLQVVANNVANLGTDGFGRSALQRQAQPDGGVYGYVVPASSRGDGLADDMAQALSDRLIYEANAKVMKAGNGLLGTLFDAFA